jgi:hypothetical protein
MAMTNEQLMIELGLDATKVTKSLSQLKTQLKALENQRALTKTEADLDIVNRKIGLVKSEMAKIQNFGFDNLQNSSKQARTAVSSLSIAIQDLPFGFIGIQNNLPGVIQGFGNLASESKNLKDFSSTLLSQLTGPAGLFLAFSAVTSIVTVAVQKYGSLGGAIDALLGRQSTLNTEIAKFNEEYEKFAKNQLSVAKLTQNTVASQQGQITVVQALAKRAKDLTLSQQEQKNVIEELKNVNQDFFGGLKAGKSTVTDIDNAVNKYVKVLIAKSKIQAYKDEIDATKVLSVENIRLANAQNEVVKSDKNRNFVRQQAIGIGDNIIANTVAQLFAIKSNIKEQENLNASSTKLTTRLNTLTKGIDAQTGVVIKNSQVFQKATEDVKKYFEAYKPPKEYLDFFRLFDDKSKFERGQELFQDLGNIDFTKGANSVTKFNEVIETLKQDFPNLFEGFGVSSAEEIPKQFVIVRKILRQALDNLALGIVADGETSQINKLGGKLADAYFDITDVFTKKIDKSKGKVFQEVKKLQDGFFDELDPENYIAPGELTKLIAPFDLGDLNKQLPKFEQFVGKILELRENAKKATLSFVQDIRDTANVLNDLFFNPLQDQFTKLIETGKFSFREFGRAVLDNMKQLVAKLVATGIITLLATIATMAINPGAAAATKLTGFQLFGRAFAGQLGFGPQRGPNLANIGAGGLAMSGAVNLTLRGSDLVGALNRTNTNINRIG